MITIGADIHIHCEYKDEIGWHNCDNHVWNDITNEYEFEDLYWGRNYDLFGILAGVRSSEYPQIDEPRGLPKDMSAKTKEYADEWEGDAHSHSYITMRELLKWRDKYTRKWRKLKKKYGVVKCSDSYYGDYIIDDNDEVTFKEEHHMLDYLISLLKLKMDNYFYCYEEEDFYNKGDDFRIVFWFDS